jgi:hypothetical protein
VSDRTFCKNNLVSVFLLNPQSTHSIPSPSHTKKAHRPQPDTHRATRTGFLMEKSLPQSPVSYAAPATSIPIRSRRRCTIWTSAPAPSSKASALSRQIGAGGTSSLTRGRLRLETCQRGGLPRRRVVPRQVCEPASRVWLRRSDADACRQWSAGHLDKRIHSFLISEGVICKTSCVLTVRQLFRTGGSTIFHSQVNFILSRCELLHNVAYL